MQCSISRKGLVGTHRSLRNSMSPHSRECCVSLRVTRIVWKDSMDVAQAAICAMTAIGRKVPRSVNADPAYLDLALGNFLHYSKSSAGTPAVSESGK